MIKRVVLFMLTNILVVVGIGIITSLLGVNHWLTRSGIDYGSLLAFCFVWGFAGSLFSLLLSRIMAKAMTGAKLIDPHQPGQYVWLVDMVQTLSKRAKLPTTPEVAVYPSSEVNAFATGPSKSRALVAVSEGLLSSMKREEIEAVVGHEIAHIANGDMVTLTLIQGVVNSFVMFFSRVIAFGLSGFLRGNQRDDEESSASPMLAYILTPILEILFGILGMMVVAAFSRYREYRADKGSAQFLGSPVPMISALQRLGALHGGTIEEENGTGQQALAAFKISSPRRILGLFSTHPPLEARIAALQAK